MNYEKSRNFRPSDDFFHSFLKKVWVHCAPLHHFWEVHRYSNLICLFSFRKLRHFCENVSTGQESKCKLKKAAKDVAKFIFAWDRSIHTTFSLVELSSSTSKTKGNDLCQGMKYAIYSISRFGVWEWVSK